MNPDKVKKYLSEDRNAPRCSGIRYDDLASLVSGVKPLLYAGVAGAADAANLDMLCSDLKLEKLVLGANNSVVHGTSTVDVLVGTNLKKMQLAAKSYSNVASYDWGVALGYPECCVRHFTTWNKLPGHSDLIAHTCAAHPPTRPISFLLNNVCNFYSRLFDPGYPEAYRSFGELNQGIDRDPIIPWHPCSYACGKSLAAGRKIYEVLAHYVPNIAAFRRTLLSRPIIFWSGFRFAVLDGECRSENGGFAVNYKGVSAPWSLTDAKIIKALAACRELKISAAGKVIWARTPRLPRNHIFLPFSSEGPAAPPNAIRPDRQFDPSSRRRREG